MKSEDVLSTSQIAELLSVSPRTVTKWFDSGQLRGWRVPSQSGKTGSGHRRVSLRGLLDFIHKHQMNELMDRVRALFPRRIILCGCSNLLVHAIAPVFGTDIVEVNDTYSLSSELHLNLHSEMYIIIDLRTLGRGHGSQAALSVRRDAEQAVIIGLLAEDETKSLEMMEFGFNHVLQHPIDPKLVVQLLEKSHEGDHRGS